MPVKGITSIEQVALVNVEGAGMIGVPGTAHRLFGALREANVSVILISQGSSEHSICCAVPGAQAEPAVRAVREAFARELADGQIQSVDIDRELAILAVVGDGMAGIPGIAGKVFEALGSAAVNVRAIAQGASERNISVVVDGKDATRALRAVHAGFYLSPHTLSIGVIGPGTVGRVLLDQLATQAARLHDLKLDLRVRRGILASKKMLLSEKGVNLSAWQDEFAAATTPTDLAKFVEHVGADYLPHRVIIDCTASSEVAKHYAAWLAAGIHVVTPNKKANSADLPSYRALHEARRAGGSHYLYEATVGAGLPIIQTVRDLRETGDTVQRIAGTFSGTLGYVMTGLQANRPFSEIVREAHQLGYTEPDPRDDLSGTDVARKLIILARGLGWQLDLTDVQVTGLYPAEMDKLTVAEFMDQLPQLDQQFQAQVNAASAVGKVLRFAATVENGQCRVGPTLVDAGSPLGRLSGTDNLVEFYTRWYTPNPLVVQGRGAGVDATASGVLADVTDDWIKL